MLGMTRFGNATLTELKKTEKLPMNSDFFIHKHQKREPLPMRLTLLFVTKGMRKMGVKFVI